MDDANFKAHYDGADDYNASTPRINHANVQVKDDNNVTNIDDANFKAHYNGSDDYNADTPR